MPAQKVMPVFSQSKQIQKHLQSHAVIDIAIIEIFLSRLIIHHPKIPGRAGIPHIHPIHKATEHRVHGMVGNGYGRQSFSAAKAKLKFHRFKAGILQFLP